MAVHFVAQCVGRREGGRAGGEGRQVTNSSLLRVEAGDKDAGWRATCGLGFKNE